MQELIRIQSIPEINELSSIKVTSNIYVIDFIGNNVLASLIKKEFIGLKSNNKKRLDLGRPRMREDRDGVEFNLKDNQLIKNDSIMAIMSEDAYCNNDLLRIYSIGYAPDKIRYYSQKILKESPFDSFKLYMGNIDGFLSKQDIDNYNKTYEIELLNVWRDFNLNEFTEHVNKNLLYEF